MKESFKKKGATKGGELRHLKPPKEDGGIKLMISHRVIAISCIIIYLYSVVLSILICFFVVKKLHF